MIQINGTSPPRGAVAIIAIIIVTALVVLVSVSLSYIAIGNLQIGFSEQRGNDVLLTAESCVEEAMLRLTRDNGYSGGTLTVGDVQCSISVIGVPCGTCTISSEANAAGFSRTIEAEVSVSGGSININSWQEVE